MWFQDTNIGRANVIKGKVTSINLQGKGFKGYFFKKEVIETVFTMELSFGSCVKWNCTRSFDEFRVFFDTLHANQKVKLHSSRLTAPFPSGADGDDDVMILVERKELIDNFLREVLGKIDYWYFPPLKLFIKADENLGPIERKLSAFQRRYRIFNSKKKFNQALFKFYSREINGFSYYLEEGIEVLELPHFDHGPPAEMILWLDVSDESALSRICIAPKEIFDLPPEYEDDRLANGLFLSDIAEVRSGQSSFGFKINSHLNLKSAQCLSIVGSERTLDFQLKDAGDMARISFIDTLRLLVLRSMHYNELKLRNKRWQREALVVANKRQGLPSPYAKNMSAARVKEAMMMRSLLMSSIQVEEEVYSPEVGLQVISRFLRFDEAENTLYISAVPTTTADDSSEQELVRCIDVDDISEVRPGKMSALIDGSDNMLMLTVVATETILCLPVASIALRNALIQRFQSFIEYFQSSNPGETVFSHRKSSLIRPGVACLATPDSIQSLSPVDGSKIGDVTSGQYSISPLTTGTYFSGGRSTVAVHVDDAVDRHGVNPTLFPCAPGPLMLPPSEYDRPTQLASPRGSKDEFDMLAIFEEEWSQSNERLGQHTDMSGTTLKSSSADGEQSVGGAGSTGEQSARPKKRRSLTGSTNVISNTPTPYTPHHYPNSLASSYTPHYTQSQATSHMLGSSPTPSSLRSVSMVRKSISGAYTPATSGAGLLEPRMALSFSEIERKK